MWDTCHRDQKIPEIFKYFFGYYMYMKATSIFAKQSIPEKPLSAFMFFQKGKK